MFAKIESLNNIVTLGLNVHQFHIPETYEDFVTTAMRFGHCTIRTDHMTISEDLPFYVFNSVKDSIKELDLIWLEAQANKYKLIVSNGIKHDPIQKYNMVVKLQKNGDFLFEASDLKIPLRHMYRHPSSLLSCTGNLVDGIHLWHTYSLRYGINKLAIRRDLLTLYSYELFDKWLEVTSYPREVGVKNEPMVFWQIK